MMTRMSAIVLVVCAALTAWCEPSGHPTAVDRVIEQISAREADNIRELEKYSPLVETYVQTFNTDREVGRIPAEDHYFLGRASFKGRIRDEDFLGQEDGGGVLTRLLRQVANLGFRNRTGWVPLGIAQMAVVDAEGFNRKNYDFRFQRREFLGEVRCLVFDVVPKPKSGRGRFLGRIWVEEAGYNIVRFNGTYVRPRHHSAYVHFDSWRVNVASGHWLPAYIYGEESAVKINGKVLPLRSQTRFWGYASSARLQDEFTAIVVDNAVVDQSGAGALSPVASERAWERQAENNVLERLERAGVLAPPSDVDKVLATVVNNLVITNDLTVEPEIRCRVLLTAPIESFTVGHTIVVSRGLLDVLPDEASLAAVLAHELSHIVLAHQLDTKFAFSDRLLFADDETISRLAMMRSADDERDADRKGMELLEHSPYKDKLAGVGLFMKQLQASQGALKNLVRGRLGNSFADGERTSRLDAAATHSPELNHRDLQQVAALPLGARIEVDPWSNSVSMSKAKPVRVLNPHEKMPFQITPFYPYLSLSRSGAPERPAVGAAKGGE